MTKGNEKLSRRKVLQTTSIALGSLSVANTVNAEEGVTNSNTINLDTSSIDYVDNAQIVVFSDGNYTITASGSEVPQSNEKIPVLQIETKYGDGPTSSKPVPIEDFQPDRVEGTIEIVDTEQVIKKGGSGGGSNKEHASGRDPNTHSFFSSSSVEAQAEESDSGTDYTTDYEGGLQVGLSEASYNDINHGQTSRWSSSGGEVTSYSDRYWCWYVGPNAAGADHQAGGFQETDWGGDTLYSKSFSQYYRDLTYKSYYAYLYAALTMNPDGTMGWWGQTTTQGNEGQYDPPTSYFSLKTQYWSYCKNWA
ncbi:hypothetical protein [Halomarina pelagica]|uniref:hypothetical protein n=1 Tax=Halomarina pelagica TaxID=2961599 RepID=UPI0020C36102|nr:hypothetical protein [Halomarina sp. BND7]